MDKIIREINERLREEFIFSPLFYLSNDRQVTLY